MKKLFLALLGILSLISLSAQTVGVGINTTGNNPHASAILDVQSSDRGILIPRMTTTERTTINNPVQGLLVYDTDSDQFWYHDGNNWLALSTNLGIMEDSDADTYISVERSPDEDIIRLTAADRLVARVDDQAFRVNTPLRVNPTFSPYLSPVAGVIAFPMDIANSTGSGWQSFTCPGNGRLNVMGFYFSNLATGSYTIQLYKGEGTSGQLLGTTTLTPNLNQVNTFSFPNEILLEANTMYTASFSSIMGLGYLIGDPMPNGRAHLGASADFAMLANMYAEDGAAFNVVNGRVGIQNDDPQYLLHLGEDTGRKLALLQNASGTDFYGFGINNQSLELHAGSNVNDEPLMVVRKSGRVGIGTTNPTRAKLEIDGSVSFDPGVIGYLNAAGATGSYNPNAFPDSIYASNVISGQEFHAHSDQRIKNIQGVSDGEEDLGTLMQIEVTDYRLRDSIAKGNHPIKKVIAQQVAEVYPQAVSTDLTEVVPDIYQRAEVQDGWIMLATDLQVGERVKLITEEGNEVYEVSAVEAGRFQVSGLASRISQQSDLASQVFVYGREVDDFHTVDYEALSMLNMSATQEQQRIIEAQQKRVETLEARLEQMGKLAARLQVLEATLAPNYAKMSAVSPN